MCFNVLINLSIDVIIPRLLYTNNFIHEKLTYKVQQVNFLSISKQIFFAKNPIYTFVNDTEACGQIIYFIPIHLMCFLGRYSKCGYLTFQCQYLTFDCTIFLIYF